VVAVSICGWIDSHAPDTPRQHVNKAPPRAEPTYDSVELSTNRPTEGAQPNQTNHKLSPEQRAIVRQWVTIIRHPFEAVEKSNMTILRETQSDDAYDVDLVIKRMDEEQQAQIYGEIGELLAKEADLPDALKSAIWEEGRKLMKEYNTFKAIPWSPGPSSAYKFIHATSKSAKGGVAWVGYTDQYPSFDDEGKVKPTFTGGMGFWDVGSLQPGSKFLKQYGHLFSER
jgi:hypothetical protein